jgi:hypothetical protein
MFDSGTTLIETVERPVARRRSLTEGTDETPRKRGASATAHRSVLVTPTADVRRASALEETRADGACDIVGVGVAKPRRVQCSEFVELARRMGIRTDAAIRQFVDLR